MHHDHGHHAGEEQEDHERVDNGKPVDLVVDHLQVRVPPRRPADVGHLEHDVVGVDYLLAYQVEDLGFKS